MDTHDDSQTSFDTDEHEAEEVEETADEELPPLEAFRDRVTNLENIFHTFEDAQSSAAAAVFLGLPVISWSLDWHGFWGSLAFGLGFALAWLVPLTVIASLPPFMKRNWLILSTLATAPLALFAWWTSRVYEPEFAGPLAALGAGLVLFLSASSKSREKRLDKAKLQLSPQLVKECEELATEGLHEDVYAILAQAVEDRLAAVDALRSTLDKDLGVNAYAVLADFDAALVDLMNRAKPVSDLQKRNRKSADPETSRRAAMSYASFEELAQRIHDLSISLLSYAGSPDANVLSDLQKRAEDLAALGNAHRELESA